MEKDTRKDDNRNTYVLQETRASVPYRLRTKWWL